MAYARIAITNQPPAGYYYYDPYCEREFSTLDLYLEHLQGYDHAWLVEAVEIETGRPVHAYEYLGGRWVLQD